MSARIRLVVSDLDGTLLPRSGRLGKRTREVMRAIRRQGVYFSIATGRLFHHALPIADELGADPLICCDGAMTRNAFGDDAARALSLSRETARDAFAQLFFYADAIFLLGHDIIYAAPEADELLVAPWGNRVIRFDPWDDLPDGLQAILSFGQKDLLVQAARLLQRGLPDVDASLIEDLRKGLVPLIVRPRGADKGSALADLRRRLGLHPAEVMVFGDWPNDLPMFREAGCAVAPRNAHSAVKKAATYVSDYSSEEEFVARELERVIL
ncbi:MAG: HAD family hydrolase [Bacteroidota bacterium]